MIYAVIGFVVAIFLPASASFIEVIRIGNGVSWDSFLEVYHKIPMPLKFVAPTFLGLLGVFFGVYSQRRLREQEMYANELRQYSSELEHRNASLQELNETMDGLVYTASHDLKTPVVNFKGLLKMLRMVKDRPGSEAMVGEILDKLDLASDRFMRTIGDLLDISRLEAKIEAESARVDISVLVEDILQDLEEQVKKSNAIIHLETEGARELLLPPQDLRSILQNLLSNAIKYSHPDRLPEISIRSYKASDNLILEVGDKGLGIDLKIHGEKMFRMFSRLHDGTGGNGVGLYIVKRTMDRLGGSIAIESEPDKGTIFQLKFPSICIP